MKIISPATIEPISLDLARKQCKVDPESDGGSPPTFTHIDDPLIEIFIGAAREYCEASLGLTIAPTTVQIVLSAFDGTITLEGGPVSRVLSITYVDPETGADLLVDESIYALNTNAQIATIVLNPEQSWPAAKAIDDSIRVQYVVGYSLDTESPQDLPLPNSIKSAMLLLISHLYKHREETTAESLQSIPLGAAAFLRPLQLRRGFA